MVAPLSPDQQEAARKAVALEPVLLENTLRAEVVGERSRFDPVETELAERALDEGAYRTRGEAPPIPGFVDPVGEDCRLERTAGDTAQADEARRLAVVEDQPAVPGGIENASTLILECEVLVPPGRVERGKEDSVCDPEVEDGLRVRFLEAPDDQNRPSGSAVDARRRRARRPRSTTSNLPCSAASAIR